MTRDVTVVDSSLPVREFAEADFTRHGTLTGTYLDRFEPDGSLEGINETPSGGKPFQRTSQLEHTWNIPFRGGDAVVHLLASASQAMNSNSLTPPTGLAGPTWTR